MLAPDKSVGRSAGDVLAFLRPVRLTVAEVTSLYFWKFFDHPRCRSKAAERVQSVLPCQSRQCVYNEVFIMAKNSTPAASTPTPMTAAAAARIQAATARGNDGKVQSGSFAARAQKAAAGHAGGKK